MPVFGPTRAALAAAAARGAQILPSLRLVLTAEALTAPPPPCAVELNAELEVLCAAAQELAARRAGWLYFCPAQSPLAVRLPRRLLQSTVLTFLRGVLRSRGQGVVRVVSQPDAAVRHSLSFRSPPAYPRSAELPPAASPPRAAACFPDSPADSHQCGTRAVQTNRPQQCAREPFPPAR